MKSCAPHVRRVVNDDDLVDAEDGGRARDEPGHRRRALQRLRVLDHGARQRQRHRGPRARLLRAGRRPPGARRGGRPA